MMAKTKFFLLLAIILVLSFAAYSQIDLEEKKFFGDNEEVNAIVVLKNGKEANKDEILKNLNLKSKNKLAQALEYDFDLKNSYSTVNAFSGKLKRASYQKLKSSPNVEIIKDNARKFALDASVPQVNATNVWRVIHNGTNITGKGESVCVVDSGIDYTHTSLGNCSSAQFLAGNCSKVISGYDFKNNDNDPIDDQGHGTHVSGIIASTDATYRGVAPAATLIAMKVCDSSAGGNCLDSDIIAAIDWCISNASKFNISVISMSLGSDTLFSSYCDDESTEAGLKAAIDSAVGKNISVIVAAGNDNSKTQISSPACLKNSTSVSSVTKQDAVSSFSNRNSITDLFAPGSSIKSTVPKNGCVLCDPSGYLTLSGTSMSAPHVTGAFALLHQFKKLEQNLTLTPYDIQDALNDTGKQIDDTSGSGLFFSRINIYAALLSLNNSAPNITSFYPQELNITIKEPNNLTFNITANDLNEDVITIAWYQNGTLKSTTNRFAFAGNFSSAGFYNITVEVSDNSLNANLHWNLTVNNTNFAPNVTSVAISNADYLNRTNGTLQGSWNFSDFDNDAILSNETLWYLNGTLNAKQTNKTIIAAENTTRLENWTFSVRIFDGINWSNFMNSSTIRIENAKPSISTENSLVVVQETQLANISFNATDLDNDSLLITSNKSEFQLSGKSLLWYTNLESSGLYDLNVTANDSLSIDSAVINVLVADSRDSDNDGNPDFNESDDDNDGIIDDDDFLLGNLSSINTTLQLNISINGTSNLSDFFNGTLPIEIKKGDDLLIEFNFTFNLSNILDLGNLTINATSNGSSAVSIKGNLNLLNATKTFFLEKRNATAKSVCIKDANSGFDLISSSCDSANETLVICNNSSNAQYACFDTGTRYKVSGLSHSAVKEQCRDNDGDGFGSGCASGDDCNDNDASKTTDCSSQSSSGGSSGGGGGGGGSSGGGGGGFAYVCNQGWQCGTWSACVNGIQTRECNFVKVPQHAQETACPTTEQAPATNQICEATTPLLNPTNFSEVKTQPTEFIPSTEVNATEAINKTKERLDQPTGFTIKNIIGKNISSELVIWIALISVLSIIGFILYKRKKLQ